MSLAEPARIDVSPEVASVSSDTCCMHGPSRSAHRTRTTRCTTSAAGTGCEAALDCERWLTHERITERWDLPKGEEERV